MRFKDLYKISEGEFQGLSGNAVREKFAQKECTQAKGFVYSRVDLSARRRGRS